LFSAALRVLDGIPRHELLSAAGGIAVAYVFLGLLPALSEHQATVEAAVQGGPLAKLESHAYIVALATLILFYALERVARASKRSGPQAKTSTKVFWLHISLFALENALIGYLLLQAENRTLLTLLLFSVAMMLKFVVNDHSLHDLHKDAYDGAGRWLLAGAVFLGWGIGAGLALPAIGPALLEAFLAGAVILNVLKEELPEERQARIWPFALGALAYGLLLLVI
jgi:hypothetical protein